MRNAPPSFFYVSVHHQIKSNHPVSPSKTVGRRRPVHRVFDQFAFDFLLILNLIPSFSNSRRAKAKATGAVEEEEVAEVAAESTRRPRRHPAEAVTPAMAVTAATAERGLEAAAAAMVLTRKANNFRRPVPVSQSTKSTRPAARNAKNHRPKKKEKPPKHSPSFSVCSNHFVDFFSKKTKWPIKFHKII